MVAGHSFNAENHYSLDVAGNWIYLFHMPAFFIIGGVLHKKVRKENISAGILSRAKRLLVPYSLYVFPIGFIVALIKIFVKRYDLYEIVKLAFKLLWGGKYLGTFYMGPCWYLTAYLMSTVIVSFITLIDNKWIRYALYTVCWSIAHLHVYFLGSVHLPGAIEIGVLGATYYGFGYEARGMLRSKVFIRIGYGIALLFIFLYCCSNLKLIRGYGLELWAHHYMDYLLDFMIPIVFTECVIGMCLVIEKYSIVLKGWLVELGKHTLPVMALHDISNIVLVKALGRRIPVLYTLIGVIVPFTIYKYVYPKLFKGKEKYLM